MAMKINPTCNSIMHEMFYFIMISLLIKNAPTQKPKRDQQTATTRKNLQRRQTTRIYLFKMAFNYTNIFIYFISVGSAEAQVCVCCMSVGIRFDCKRP